MARPRRQQRRDKFDTNRRMRILHRERSDELEELDAEVLTLPASTVESEVRQGMTPAETEYR